MEGVFVTGTGTGVGKSVVAASLAAALTASGRPVHAAKPVLSGLDEPAGAWPPDHELLAAVTGQDPVQIAPRQFGPAVSPHLAARLAGVSLSVAELAAEAAVHEGHVAVIEGAGGLLVPINDDGATMADLAAAIGLPLVVAAAAGLGTINHVMLTLEAARARGLQVAGVVLTPWSSEPTQIEADNLAYLRLHAGCSVLTLARVPAPQPAQLALAGERAGLPALLQRPAASN